MNFDPTIDARYGIPASIVDVEGKRILVSDAFATLVGRPCDELLGRPWQDISHPQDVKSVIAARQRLVETGTSFSAPWRHIRPDGSYLDGNVHVTRQIRPSTGQFMVQTNFQPAEARRPTVDDQAVVDYIRSITGELCKMANRHDLKVLEHLLRMANAEAIAELEKHVPGDILQVARQNNRLH